MSPQDINVGKTLLSTKEKYYCKTTIKRNEQFKAKMIYLTALNQNFIFVILCDNIPFMTEFH